MKTLVLVEHDGSSIKDATLATVTAAAQLGDVDLLVVGSHSHGAELAVPLGRTAARVVQLSEAPVYLVPMLQHRGHGEM